MDIKEQQPSVEELIEETKALINFRFFSINESVHLKKETIFTAKIFLSAMDDLSSRSVIHVNVHNGSISFSTSHDIVLCIITDGTDDLDKFCGMKMNFHDMMKIRNHLRQVIDMMLI